VAEGGGGRNAGESDQSTGTAINKAK